MDRLTMTSDLGGLAFTFDLDITCRPSEAQKILKLGEKLKHYEDLEEAGRLIEPPCAVGDTVYVVTACENVVMNHDNDYFTGTGAIKCPYEDDCPYADCGDENKRVFETYCSTIYLDEDGFNIILEDFAFTATLEDFGKTVFLTKEEAERKLKELEGDNV